MAKLTGEIKQVIEENWATFSTVNDEGGVHSIAVAEVRVIDDSRLLITDNFMAETKRNLEKNNQIALLFLSGDWRSEDCKAYELRGEAIYHSKGEWLKRVKEDSANEGLPAKGAIVFRVDKIKDSF
jgi:predicted pyridoxine 5'-phosphate oxidase superfamily flavin-nucleotide-binding protein